MALIIVFGVSIFMALMLCFLLLSWLMQSRAAAVDRCGADRSPANAPRHAAVRGTQPDPGRHAAAVRVGDRIGVSLEELGCR